MRWKRVAGQWMIKVGPFQLCVYEYHPETPDRDPSKPWDMVIWRSGITVATDCAYPDDATARRACKTLLKNYIESERKLFDELDELMEPK